MKYEVTVTVTLHCGDQGSALTLVEERIKGGHKGPQTDPNALMVLSSQVKTVKEK